MPSVMGDPTALLHSSFDTHDMRDAAPAGVPKAPAGLPSKLHEARYVADIQTNRLLRQLRAAIK